MKHRKFSVTLSIHINLGFSTLEIVIALAILSMICSSVAMVSFGSRSLLIDAELSNEALVIVNSILLNQKQKSEKDFKLIHSEDETRDGIYTNIVQVETLPDFFTKRVSVTTRWLATGNRNQHTAVAELVTNADGVVGGDTCDSNLSGDWKNPRLIKEIDLSNLLKNSYSYPVTDVDVYLGKLYVTTNNSSLSAENFFVFDISNPQSPILISKLDNDLLHNTGINGVVVAQNSGGTYAYVASASSFVAGQLQIIDVAVNSVVKTYKIPASIVQGSSSQGVGNSIIYKNGYVFLGLKKTVSGPEFNIIDVHDPNNPFWVGGYSIGNAVNSMAIVGDRIFIATPNQTELIALSLNDLSHPTLLGSFDAPDSVGNGKALYSVGDLLYFGRTVTSKNPEFLILENSDSENILQGPVSSQEIGESVDGIIVKNFLVFILTNHQLKIFSTRDEKNIEVFTSPITFKHAGGSPVPSFDCEYNTFFIGSNDSENKGYVEILTAS